MQYVGGKRVSSCIFCSAAANPEDSDKLVLHMGQLAFMLLNRFPYNSGHLMIVPYEHVPSIEDLTAETRSEMMEMANLAIEAARPVFRCDGFNIGLNIGQVAGAGIADHLHMHLVPRWTGDANFMPILGDTMVLPETLPATHARLRAEFATRIARDSGQHDTTAGALVYLPEVRKFVLRTLPGRPAVLPKGHIEAGETAAEAAVREVLEETGINATIVGWLGAQIIGAADTPSGNSQHAVYFLAQGKAMDGAATDVTLVEPGALLSAISLPGLREVIQSALPAIQELTRGSA